MYVIDAGKVKETQYDSETNLSRLVETWVTRAAAKQRRGRAGRTQPGTCYKLYTKKQEMNMIKFPVPEILRVPLESILLAVKATKEDQDVKVGDLIFLDYISTHFAQSFLSQAIDPPSVAAMDRALTTLEELGAIDNGGTLTALGKHMVSLVCSSIFYKLSLTPPYLFYSQCFLWTSGLPKYVFLVLFYLITYVK